MLVPNKHNRASPAQVHAHAERAVEAALTYFGQRNADFTVTLLAESPEGDASATCNVDLSYLRATIRYSPDYHSEHPELIWGTLGHEVAHLVSRELCDLRGRLTKRDTLKHTQYTQGIEALTTRLQRMFERDVPDPGWESD